MNKFLTKPIIYANKIATYIDFANINCDKNKFYCSISKLESFPKNKLMVCRIILTSQSKDLYF